MPSSEGITAPQRADRASPKTDAEWEKHRETITQLFYATKLDRLIEVIRKEHGFSARQVRSTHGSTNDN